MALRTCPSCGTQYVATVRRCIDCGATLVDDSSSASASAADAKSTSSGTGDRDHVGYELPGWGNQLKTSLDGMLQREGVPRVWEAAALVVPVEFEDTVDRLIAAVEGTELPELDDDEAQVALEIEGLDAEAMDELDSRLVVASVPHAWDEEGSLLVAEADEAQVLEIIGSVFDGLDDEDEGSGDANAVLSALFVVVDRLVKRPDDAKLARAYRDAADPLDGLGVPYGFEPDAWQEVVAEAEALRALLADDDTDEDEPDGDDDPGDEDDERGEDDVRGEDEPDDEDEDEDEDEDDDDDADDDDAEDDGTEDGSPVERRARALRDRLREIV